MFWVKNINIHSFNPCFPPLSIHWTSNRHIRFLCPIWIAKFQMSNCLQGQNFSLQIFTEKCVNHNKIRRHIKAYKSINYLKRTGWSMQMAWFPSSSFFLKSLRIYLSIMSTKSCVQFVIEPETAALPYSEGLCMCCWSTLLG